MTTELAPVLTALADPTRRRVVQLLRERPYRAGELAAASGTSAPTMSRHLRVLLEAGVVADERLPDDAR
ncbi:MAG: metalloregulator ArsR/SmtB family transcription factor, partial [Gaiellaceae bacterium]